MPRCLREILEDLDQVLAEAPDRQESSAATTEKAAALATKVPLVHRTGHKPGWRNIFLQEVIVAQEPGTDWEKANGPEKAVYLFWGHGSFPKGMIALILSDQLAVKSTATPFDTGACERGYLFRSGQPLTKEQSAAALDRYMLDDGSKVASFGASYLAAHFRIPRDYLLLSQEQALPDWPAFHGLSSPTGDRRAWTIEVQAHDDVPVPPDPMRLAILVAGPDLLDELRSYKRIAKRAATDAGDDFDQAISDEVVRRVESE